MKFGTNVVERTDNCFKEGTASRRNPVSAGSPIKTAKKSLFCAYYNCLVDPFWLCLVSKVEKLYFLKFFVCAKFVANRHFDLLLTT